MLPDEPAYRGQCVARLVTDAPSLYVLVAASLPQLQAQLPPGLMRSARQPADPPGVVEIWYAQG